ncbi:hypothetical protein WR25_04905 [Diploscapter pachys]|uniref:Uncharacterized protein n=1 Tax=Diploscapter pachys TaxID=2018661 RepID=A0A2A2JII0_9BILA|nr:hypothetical protein WR25_04905 [Diploscapter pachys]
MAERMGLDKRMTEAVDAESGSTIDPARQALDALSSRTVRLCPVVTFAVEILPPNFTAKCPVAPTRYIIIRARNSLSAGAILRPLLGKYFVDLAQAVVCYSGTLQVVRSNASVASIGQRTLTVMNQSQYNDLEQEFLGENAGKKTFPLPKDPVILAPEVLEEHNLAFHQHGDAGYCELPADVEKKLTKGRKEHLGILNKFVRAVSHTHKDGQGQPDKPEKRLSGRRKSTGQSPTAGVYCGDDVGPSTSNAQADEADGKKRLSLFRNYFKSKDGTGQTSSGPGSATQSPPPRDSPRLTPRDRPSLPPPQPRPPLITTNMSPRPAPNQSVGTGTGATGSQENECAPNGHSKGAGVTTSCAEEAPRTPAIFSTKIDVDATGGIRESGWKHASFV